MNGFTDRGLDESNFDENNALKVVKAFDAFPKTKPSYTEKTSSGGAWTLLLICASLALAWTELQRWWVGDTTHTFSVEQGIGHDLQINIDLVVRMKCEDLHINVQDAAGDRILAGMALKKDPTLWSQRLFKREAHTLGATKDERLEGNNRKAKSGEYREEDVHDYLGAARTSKKFSKTPRLPRRREGDSCRIYGSMDSNKVQGDFHITARGHGYMEFGEHLDHKVFNFTHQVTELSFGPFYPSLVNPLDNTVAYTQANFYRFQYFLSVVPTIYTTDAKSLRKLDKYSESPSGGEDGLKQHPYRFSKNTVFTNQYAVTEQSREIPENGTPGIFVKFDIEPIQLMIAEEWDSFPALFIRLVNVISGIVVAGGWCYQITEWARDIYGRKGRRIDGFGMINGGMDMKRGV